MFLTSSSFFSPMDEAYDVQLKILLVGDSGVGKSSLLLRFTDRKFDDLTPTIGTYCSSRRINTHIHKQTSQQVWISKPKLWSTMTCASNSHYGTQQARNAFAHSHHHTTGVHRASYMVCWLLWWALSEHTRTHTHDTNMSCIAHSV